MRSTTTQSTSCRGCVSTRTNSLLFSINSALRKDFELDSRFKDLSLKLDFVKDNTRSVYFSSLLSSPSPRLSYLLSSSLFSPLFFLLTISYSSAACLTHASFPLLHLRFFLEMSHNQKSTNRHGNAWTKFFLGQNEQSAIWYSTAEPKVPAPPPTSIGR